MNIRSCVLLFCGFTCLCDVCRGAEFERSHIISAWGKAPLRQTCGTHAGNSFFCIGKQAECNNSTATPPDNSGAHGVMMLVAKADEKKDTKGAMFYPTLLLSEGSCHGGCTTTRNVAGGYGTPLCNPKSNGSCLGYDCYDVEFNASKFSTITTTDCINNNTEWTLQTFYRDNYTWRRCNRNEWYGEDTVILGVEKFESGGHGAWVRPYGYRTYTDEQNGNTKKVAIYPISAESSQLWCVPGYVQDSSKTKCIKIASVAACGTWCPTWTREWYEKLQAERVIKVVNGCLQSRCKDPKKAFDKNWRCTVDCIKDGRNGISPEDGTCVTCPDGQVFDENASQSAGYCKKATALNKVVMQYGTKGQNVDFDKQCWSMVDDAQYRDCIFGKEVVKTKMPGL